MSLSVLTQKFVFTTVYRDTIFKDSGFLSVISLQLPLFRKQIKMCLQSSLNFALCFFQLQSWLQKQIIIPHPWNRTSEHSILLQKGCFFQLFAVCIQLFIYSNLKRNILVKLGIELNCIYSVNISKFQKNVIKSSKEKKTTWKPDSCTHFVSKKPFFIRV